VWVPRAFTVIPLLVLCVLDPLLPKFVLENKPPLIRIQRRHRCRQEWDLLIWALVHIRISHEAHIIHAQEWKCSHFVTRIVHRQVWWNLSVTSSKDSAFRNTEWSINVFFPSDNYIKLKVTLENFSKPTVHKIYCRRSDFTSSTYPSHRVTEISFMKRLELKSVDENANQASYGGGGGAY
jgi:hypothetical protein